jgi:hypothetical protein
MPHAPACLSASALAPGKHSTSTDTSARVSGQPACAGGAFSHGLGQIQPTAGAGGNGKDLPDSGRSSCSKPYGFQVSFAPFQLADR